MTNNKKKIIWQSHEPIISGANIAMLEYIDALSENFSFFIILTHQGKMQIELEQRNISYVIIPQYGWTNIYPWWKFGKRIKVLVRSIIAILQTLILINKEKPDILCTNTLVPFTASVAAFIQRIPHIWWIHEFGKEDFGFTTGWGHEKTSLRWMQRSSKLIIGNSKAISAKFGKLMPKATIVTIYQPVSWNAATGTESFKQARFLMFGQLVPSKGHKDVLEAIILNKRAGKPLHKLHIKGPCEIKSYLIELQNIIQLNDLQEVVHLEVGYFNKEEVLPNYDVLIVASQAEAFGRVIIEANKAGLRVLVRNSGGAVEMVNETNGLFFTNQNELAQALCGERRFPESLSIINYNEKIEIQKLTKILTATCQ